MRGQLLPLLAARHFIGLCPWILDIIVAANAACSHALGAGLLGQASPPVTVTGGGTCTAPLVHRLMPWQRFSRRQC